MMRTRVFRGGGIAHDFYIPFSARIYTHRPELLETRQRSNALLEAWERMTFGGLRITPFDRVCLLLQAGLRANEAHIDAFTETALFK